MLMPSQSSFRISRSLAVTSESGEEFDLSGFGVVITNPGVKACSGRPHHEAALILASLNWPASADVLVLTYGV